MVGMKTKRHGDRIQKPGALHRHIDKCGDPVRRRIRRKRAKESEKKQEALRESESSLKVTYSQKEYKRILKTARAQQQELEKEMFGDAASSGLCLEKPKANETPATPLKPCSTPDVEARCNDEEMVISEQDERILKAFMCAHSAERRTLADLIQEKLDEKKAILARAAGNCELQVRIDKEIVEVYKQVGQILSHYRSGKLPKAFKALPALENWEALVIYTHPENWTAASVFQATRIFASKLNSKLAERFYESILLHRIRDDIAQYKTLNHYLTMAIRKSTVKPAAFFKGIVFPLCASKDCTLREAVILCSIISRCSIPILHCGAALYKLCSMEYTGPTGLFIKTLLDKKYALHYRVIDVVTEYFMRFKEEPRLLPVIWHQSLLTFVQAYLTDLRAEQRAALAELTRHQQHHQIGPIVQEMLAMAHKVVDKEAKNAVLPHTDVEMT